MSLGNLRTSQPHLDIHQRHHNMSPIPVPKPTTPQTAANDVQSKQPSALKPMSMSSLCLPCTKLIIPQALKTRPSTKKNSDCVVATARLAEECALVASASSFRVRSHAISVSSRYGYQVHTASLDISETRYVVNESLNITCVQLCCQSQMILG